MISIEDVIEYFKNENPDKSSSTYSTMKYNIVRLQKITGIDIDDLTIDDFVSISSIMDEVQKYALNTQIQTIMGIKLFLRFKEADSSLITEYNDILKDLCNSCKEVIEKNEMSDNEKKNWIDYPILKKDFEVYFKDVFLQNMKNESSSGSDYLYYNHVRNILLLSLYILLPPTRIGNYQYMKIRDKKKRDATSLAKSYNYLMNNLDGSFEIVFNKYKTSKYIGQISHHIEKDTLLSEILQLYILRRSQFVNRLDNTAFLVAKDKKAMSQTNITDTLKYVSRKVIGKSMSCNLFRHIYISNFSTLKKSIEERKKMCNFIGQTYEPNMFDKYVRIDVEAEKKKKLVVSWD
tara:strand:- start:707 stop:1750 length:1044 start_codon:yes stop_codon:yes gene_type:complete